MELENATINLQDGFLSEFAQDEEKKTYQRDIIQKYSEWITEFERND